jgi:putative phosphoesterase
MIRDVSTSLDMTKVLVIADTHNKLPEAVREMSRDANEIWHLGDVCNASVLDEIKLLGPPVTLVRGNCDSNFEWPLVVNLTRNGTRFRLQHISPPARKVPGDCDVLLHGHTHFPRDETIGGVRFLNPGCVARPNRGAPPSVAWLELGTEGDFTWRLVLLR